MCNTLFLSAERKGEGKLLGARALCLRRAPRSPTYDLPWQMRARGGQPAPTECSADSFTEPYI